METFPADDVDRDPSSCTGPHLSLFSPACPHSAADIAAVGQMQPGDLVTIFTPDDTHYAVAKCAIEASPQM